MSDQKIANPMSYVKAKHVRHAAKRWKQEGYGSFKDSTKYDVLIGNAKERFPPKAICALALDIATGGRMTLEPSDFPGAKDGGWHKRLKMLGFEIVSKEGAPRTDSKALTHWTALPAAPDTFLVVNVTNKTSDLHNQNIAFLENNETGYWAIPNEALETPLEGKVVYLYFRSGSTRQNDIYRGVIEQAEHHPADGANRDRYLLRVAAPGWKKVGNSDKSFSAFFEGRKIGSSPVCVWVKKADDAAVEGRNGLSRKGSGQSSHLADDMAALAKRAKAGTDIATLVQARVGQGSYRKAVLKVWEGACAATGVALTSVVRASHIKPWRNSTDDERLNPYNGLPLLANLDALFDCGLITFDSQGTLHRSDLLPNKQAKKLNLPRGLLRPPSPETVSFLRHHWDAYGYEGMERGTTPTNASEAAS